MTNDSASATGTLPAPTAAKPDDLGIDRAFLQQMAQVPFFAIAWIVASVLSHFIWAQVAPESTNFGPLVVVCVGMVLAAVIDGWAFKVPNWLTLSLVLSGWGLGLLHSCGYSGLAFDGGTGGLGTAMACTAVGFFLLFPLLAIVGMGQGDVKMLMGFGSWVGAFFGGTESVLILVWAFCIGAVVGGICGLVMMIVRRKFKKNASNFKEIFVDLRVLATVGAGAAAARSQARRPGWDRLPYGIPLCVGFLGYLAYRFMEGTLPTP